MVVSEDISIKAYKKLRPGEYPGVLSGKFITLDKPKVKIEMTNNYRCTDCKVTAIVREDHFVTFKG